MSDVPSAAQKRFEGLPRTPAEHFKLHFYAAVLNLIQHLARASGGDDTVFERFPFLLAYQSQIRSQGIDPQDPKALMLWFSSLQRWEDDTATHLPLRALRLASGLKHGAIAALVTCGLAEEDPRFGALYAALQDGANAPQVVTSGLLHSLWPDVSLRELQSLGILKIDTSPGSRHHALASVPLLLWDSFNGAEESRLPDGWGAFPYSPDAPSPILSRAHRSLLEELPALTKSKQVRTLVVRGPQSNGRRLFLQQLASSRQQGTLVLKATKPEDRLWEMLGPLATLRNALAVIELDLGPNECVELPSLRAYQGPVGVLLGKVGGISGSGTEGALSIDLSLPPCELREEFWRHALPSASAETHREYARDYRLSLGHLHRLSSLAKTQAAVADRPQPGAPDLQLAARLLNRQALDALAQRLQPAGTWDDLAANELTRSELAVLEARCRHREALHLSLEPSARNVSACGVRALFSGASGTGKTLAARILAAELGRDLYRIDLASVVNKYIGETEKNLDRIFSRAEELDIILLLDEGDALMAQRTGVQTSNDRYANFETNYLLQRLESFEGILLVTTNASERIDTAFHRRMDIVVEFTPPDASERRRIWGLQLPENNAVDAALLERIAARCILTGGQIKNASQHAALLALEAGTLVDSPSVLAAVEREYRKMGAPCPLRPTQASHPANRFHNS